MEPNDYRAQLEQAWARFFESRGKRKVSITMAQLRKCVGADQDHVYIGIDPDSGQEHSASFFQLAGKPIDFARGRRVVERMAGKALIHGQVAVRNGDGWDFLPDPGDGDKPKRKRVSAKQLREQLTAIIGDLEAGKKPDTTAAKQLLAA